MSLYCNAIKTVRRESKQVKDIGGVGGNCMKILKQTGMLILIILLCLVSYLAGILSTVGPTDRKFVPSDGIWYCEANQILLSFNSDSYSYIMEDGERKNCVVSNNHFSDYVSVFYSMETATGNMIGDTIFDSKNILLTENEFILKDCDSGEIYVFIRLE